MNPAGPQTPSERYDARLRRRTSGETLREQLADGERSNILTALEAAREDPALVDGAVAIVGARRRTVIGVGRSHIHAQLFVHSLRAALNSVSLLGADPEDAIDALTDFGPSDTLVAFSFRRYRGHTVRVCEHAKASGASVVVITDDANSPATVFADTTIVVPTAGGSHLDSPTAITMVGHLLATLATARSKGARRRLVTREGIEADLLDYSADPGMEP